VPAQRKDEWITTFVSYRGGTPWPLQTTDIVVALDVAFSKDGRRAVAIRRPKEVPPSWDAYERLRGLDGPIGRQKTDFPRFLLIDAERGYEKPVFDAPAGTVTHVGQERFRQVGIQALWAANGRNVVLVNTALPLSPADSTRESMAYVVGYDVESGDWSVIEPLEAIGPKGVLSRVSQVSWLKPGTELLIQHEIDGKAAASSVYTLKGERWVGRMAASEEVPSPPSPPPSLGHGLSVTLRQGANEPPMVVASLGSRELPLTRPDPALADVAWGRSQTFEWRTATGQTQSGGLLLPENRVGRVPLVIQAYTYNPMQFSPDGPFRHTYAAQSLRARGMAVLNMRIPTMDRPPESQTLRELTEFADRVNSATEALTKSGIVDPDRVGLIGFSRAGFNIHYFITHPGSSPAAAAVIDDSFPGTYSYYLTSEAIYGSMRRSFEGMYGGSFWTQKQDWLAREPSFNADRVETPALFMVHGQHQISFAAETIGAYSLNRRPAEYLVFPDAAHSLHMPRQRLASIETTTDWMAFWLQGYEDPDRSKAEQYARWHVLREQNAERRTASSTGN